MVIICIFEIISIVEGYNTKWGIIDRNANLEISFEIDSVDVYSRNGVTGCTEWTSGVMDHWTVGLFFGPFFFFLFCFRRKKMILTGVKKVRDLFYSCMLDSNEDKIPFFIHSQKLNRFFQLGFERTSFLFLGVTIAMSHQ